MEQRCRSSPRPTTCSQPASGILPGMSDSADATAGLSNGLSERDRKAAVAQQQFATMPGGRRQTESVRDGNGADKHAMRAALGEQQQYHHDRRKKEGGEGGGGGGGKQQKGRSKPEKENICAAAAQAAAMAIREVPGGIIKPPRRPGGGGNAGVKGTGAGARGKVEFCENLTLDEALSACREGFKRRAGSAATHRPRHSSCAGSDFGGPAGSVVSNAFSSVPSSAPSSASALFRSNRIAKHKGDQVGGGKRRASGMAHYRQVASGQNIFPGAGTARSAQTGASCPVCSTKGAGRRCLAAGSWRCVECSHEWHA